MLKYLSMDKDREHSGRAIIDGAEGYLLKEHVDRELLPAIEMIRWGEVYVSSLFSGMLQN